MRRSLGLVRLQLALVARGHRFVLPLTAYVIAVALVFSPPVRPTLPAYGVAAALLYPLGAWIAIVMLGAESPEQRHVASAARGSAAAAWIARVGGVALVLIVVALVTAVLPAIAGVFTERPTVEAVGATALAMLLAVLPGGALGMLCSPAFLPSAGWRFVVCSTALLLTVPLTTAGPVGYAVPPGLTLIEFFDAPAVPAASEWWGALVVPAVVSATALLAAFAVLVRRLP